MNDQIVRQQQLLKLIPRYPRTISAQKLQDRLLDQGIEVHIRTIQRDLNALSQVFIGIDNFKNQDNGLEWFWSEDAPLLNLSGLTINQALSFVMVKKYLTPLFPEVTLNELNPFFEQAESTLEAVHGNSLHKWFKKVAVVPPTQPLLPPHIDSTTHKTIRNALLSDVQVSIVYKPNGGKAKSYQLNPLGLVIRNVVTYLIATKAETTEVRMFALHRISEANPTEFAAVQPENFNLQDYIDAGHMGFNVTGDHGIKTVKIKALFSTGAARHLYETPLSDDQQLTQYDQDKIQVTATVPDTEQLFWWLLGFGDQIEVLEPPSIRQKITEIAHNLASKYQKAD